jgi:Spy/CpxP family protein refolding chaperone
MTRKNLSIAFYLALVFVSGSVVGALGYRTYNPPAARGSNVPPAPGDWRRQYMDESKARLNLSDEQVGKLTVIMDQTEERFHEQHEHENEMLNEIREDHIARVRNILTPEQLPKYEALHQERLDRAKQQERDRKQR